MKNDEFEKLVGEKRLIFQKWLNFSPTKIFPDFFFPDKVVFDNAAYENLTLWCIEAQNGKTPFKNHAASL